MKIFIFILIIYLLPSLADDIDKRCPSIFNPSGYIEKSSIDRYRHLNLIRNEIQRYEQSIKSLYEIREDINKKKQVIEDLRNAYKRFNKSGLVVINNKNYNEDQYTNVHRLNTTHLSILTNENPNNASNTMSYEQAYINYKELKNKVYQKWKSFQKKQRDIQRTEMLEGVNTTLDNLVFIDFFTQGYSGLREALEIEDLDLAMRIFDALQKKVEGYILTFEEEKSFLEKSKDVFEEYNHILEQGLEDKKILKRIKKIAEEVTEFLASKSDK